MDKKVNKITYQKSRLFVILFSIIFRDLGAFYSQSIYNLYSAIYLDEDDIYEDERINTKITVLDFDVTMSHSLPLQYFKQYVYS